MYGLSGRLGSVLALVVVGALLGGCGSRALNRAPVEDRGTGAGRSAVMDPSTQAVKQPPGFENAGKPGYYTVKPGDTLIRIGLDHGQAAKDIARWSNLENPNRLEVGQVLRVVPPTATVTASGVVAKPVTQASATSVASVPAPAASAEKPAAAAPTPASSAPAPAAATGEDEIAWIWPTNGPVLAGFDEVKNKGLDIAGTAGDPVVAAADGRVVYVGAGLRGYGNLIILKHNNTYLTAYAHNQTLLIKEDQSVRKGQKIAEMGSSDADRVKLHFEVRRQGKPVDPAKYLPAR
ncbi:MAG: peptidoglycan DD-metalloendopeptidase family protein [Rhodoferax sp.]|uniref:peptidoglycan DD-metalloendopeptidase family protein n=1 Tax=Rhodoferax sp. TaxID=50421 RepID=UPI00271F6C54|nr:peptidoglycan DD-metalloendopeptidase family protein [Rhodoferax sp.]MDO8450649.1 peptidoglycan DD-metalloendopeptidase family protein [Rhodoferax sp.]